MTSASSRPAATTLPARHTNAVRHALRGTWMVEHLAHIEAMKDRFSVWHWVRAPWSELEGVDR